MFKTPKMQQHRLKRVIRLDSQPLNQTYFTPEGYLVDRPILTSTGIFEYENADGSVRRELRLPEDVFDPESLKSYRGVPIIITHDAGLITKDNVASEQIGTILSDGYKSGDDVRAEIIIHDTNEMKASGLKELSLGYNLDLEEVSGEWNGEPYDAIQRNIRINHLALVREARAGEQARLNIDSRSTTLKGGKLMKKKATKKTARRTARRADGLLSPEELKKAVAEYKARRAKHPEPPQVDSDEDTIPATSTEEVAAEEPVNLSTVEIQIEAVKDRRDRRDEQDDPESLADAEGIISEQDKDIGMLFDIIDTLLAQIAFDDGEEETEETALEGEETNEDDDEEIGETSPVEGEETALDDDEEIAEISEEEAVLDDDEEELLPEETNEDDEEETPSDEETATLNADSIDRIVRERVAIAKAADALNMDGLERINPMKAKKTIIRAVKPGIRLDGRSKAYINALFDLSCQDIQKRNRKNASYQMRQMFNKDTRNLSRKDSTEAAREKMIRRMQKQN